MALSCDRKEVITCCRENRRVGEISLTEEIGTVIEDSGQMTVGSLVPALAQGFPQKRRTHQMDWV